MGDRKFTLLELHLDGDPQFGPRTISDIVGGGTRGESESEAADDRDEEAGAAEDDSGGRSVVGAVVGLIVLAALAVAVKKYRGGDEDELEEFGDAEESDEPDVVVS